MKDSVDKATAWDAIAKKNAEIIRLRNALEEIDAIAVSKKAGAAKNMQAVARRALTSGER